MCEADLVEERLHTLGYYNGGAGAGIQLQHALVVETREASSAEWPWMSDIIVIMGNAILVIIHNAIVAVFWIPTN
jgi:hypothetical protein